MAFTNPWSNIIPAGSDPANTADDEIRQLRLDIDERMDTIVADWSADPIVNLTGIRKTVHWSDGNFDPLGSDTMTDGWMVFGIGVHPATKDVQNVWRLPMDIPVGAVLTEYSGRVYRDTVLSLMNVTVVEADDATPSEFVLDTSPVGGIGGWVDVGNSGLAITRVQDKPLLIKVNMTATLLAPLDSVRLFQVHYVYDITNALQGITA